jgi:hypothetical protein
MAIAFSQDHYWALLQQSLNLDQAGCPDERFDTTWNYPEHLGHGYWRSIQLRTGLELALADYHPHKPIVIECPDRHHSLEYEFLLPHQPHGRTVTKTGDYFFSGSGLATRNSCYLSTDERFLEVSVHMEPEIFCAGVSDAAGQLPTALKHLVRDQDQERHICFGHSTAAMQMVLQQIIHCPHQGLTKRIYLENKSDWRIYYRYY